MILFQTEIPGREKAGAKLFLESAFAVVPIFLVLTFHRDPTGFSRLKEGGWYAV